MDFAGFMSSTTGRLLRIAAGIALIGMGLVIVQGMGGIILAIVGTLPLAAGIGNFCIFAPVFGRPLKAKAIPVRINHNRR